MHKKMFDGMQPEQFYQFLAAATTTTTPTHHHNTNTSSLPLSFSLHNNHAQHHHFPTYSSSSPPQTSFDTSPYHHHQLILHHPHFLPRNNTTEAALKTVVETNNDNSNLHQQCSSSSELPNNPLQDGVMQRSSSLMLLPEIPWSNDEMLALFRIRSSMDNTWFPDFIWENVSRKLAELGFKRSAEKCKEKFEEETRSFNSSIIISNSCSNKVNNNNNNNNNSNNNYRLFGELEELCNTNNNTTTTTTTNRTNGNNDHGNDDGSRQQHPSPPLPPPPPDVSEHDRLLGTNEDGEEGDPKAEEGRLGVDDDDDEDEDDNDNVEDDGEQSLGDSEKTEEKNTKRVMRKRKRQKKFEMFKGFCEKIVNKMMAQQQQLHCKILQDMVKRDEEKIAKEEAWKRQEIERLEKELEFRANEQAVSGDRQAKILEVLNKFNSSSSVLDSQSLKQALEKLDKVPIVSSSNSSILSQDSIISSQLQPTSSCTTTTTTHDHSHTPVVTNQSCPNIIPGSPSNENVGLLSHVNLGNSSKLAPPMISSFAMDHEASLNPNTNSPCHKFSKSDHTSTNATDHMIDKFKALESQSDQTLVVGSGKDDTGRRWPRDEVLALINIRCSLFNNNNNGSGGDAHNDKDNFAKGPLWERISQKMMELGYNRSAKRCKEKWENINKYFRKTKDLNKKRSIDSRTCPYFHQLSHLYSQGALVGPTERPMNLSGSPENRSMPFSETQLGGSSGNLANDDTNNTMHASQGGDGVVQVPRFDFEF